jgi:hypothetical protein
MDTREPTEWRVPIVFSPWILKRERRDSRGVGDSAGSSDSRGDERISRCFGVTSRCPGRAQRGHALLRALVSSRWPCALCVDARYRCSPCLLWAQYLPGRYRYVGSIEGDGPAYVPQHTCFGGSDRVPALWMFLESMLLNHGAFCVEFVVHFVYGSAACGPLNRGLNGLKPLAQMVAVPVHL